ncbi:MAG: hypothetical protein GW757_02825 [Alphaproteobacteria bacterium]|nr:hypothetical protein [Alphaproteobacteria bacterium]
MANGKTLLVTASWEDRYSLGVRASVESEKVDKVVVLYSLRYANETGPITRELEVFCRSRGTQFVTKGFDFENQVATMRAVSETVSLSSIGDAPNLIFDISTTPRPVLWSALDALESMRTSVGIRYYAGGNYGSWQTDEEGEPRLVLRRSGIMYPDQPTALILLCGPEISRAHKMCLQFEPKSVHILRDPRAANYGEIRHLPHEYYSIAREKEFDNKDLSDANYHTIDKMTLDLLDAGNNVVAAALGPKLGALLLFRLSREQPEVGLSYVVSGRHNRSATTGLGDRADMDLSLKNLRA